MHSSREAGAGDLRFEAMVRQTKRGDTTCLFQGKRYGLAQCTRMTVYPALSRGKQKTESNIHNIRKQEITKKQQHKM